MTTITLLNSILAGGILGMLGQGVRTAVGLKKFNEDNTAKAALKPNEPQEQFSISRVVISLFTGFVAGALAMIIKGYANKPDYDLQTETIITLIAIGYSGADFIEGVFNTYIKNALPAGSSNNPTPNPNAGAATPPDQPDTVPEEANFTNSLAQG